MPITSQITLTGDPIAYGKLSKAVAFVQRSHIAATALCLAFNLAAAYFHPSCAKEAVVTGALSLPLSLVLEKKNRAKERQLIAKQTNKRPYCIETKPTDKTPDNSPFWKDVAALEKTKDKPMLVTTGVIATVCVLPHLLIGNLYAVGSLSTLYAITLLHYYGTQHRWGKVEANEWRIVEQTPPVKQEKRAKIPSLFRRFVYSAG